MFFIYFYFFMGGVPVNCLLKDKDNVKFLKTSYTVIFLLVATSYMKEMRIVGT